MNKAKSAVDIEIHRALVYHPSIRDMGNRKSVAFFYSDTNFAINCSIAHPFLGVALLVAFEGLYTWL